MGLFKKEKKESFIVPVCGTVKPIEEAKDAVFSEKMMGDGLLITPKNGTVVSPVAGEVTLVFPTKHAIGIKTNAGINVLLHFGVDTVSLNGEGFEVFVEANQKINANDLLWKADLDFIKANAVSEDLILIFTEASDNVSFDAFYGEHEQGDVLLNLK